MATLPAEHFKILEGDSLSLTSISRKDIKGYQLSRADRFFAMDVCTSIMTGAGIREGDTLVIDRWREAGSESIVIAELCGELLVRQLKIGQGRKWLVAPEAGVATIEISGQEIWGVVDHLLRKLP
jgi:DNA polymerase V